MIYQNSVAVPSEALTDYVNEGATSTTAFKGLQLAPQIGVSSLTGTYPKITIAKGDLMRAANRRRAPGSNFNRWQSAIESGTITLEQIGEEQSIPDEVAMQWEDYFDVEAMGADEAMNRLRRGHEMAVAAELMNSANFTAANGSVAYAIGNKATINLPLDVFTAIEALQARGVDPDTIVIPGSIFTVARQSTLLLNFLVGTNGAGVAVTSNSLQSAFSEFGITNVVIPTAYVNQSDSDSSAVINPIWGDDYIWVGKVGAGGLRGGGALRTAYWDKAGSLFNVSTYREEVKKQNVIRAETISNVIVTNGRAGQLIGTQV
jgi:hypothetical protein